MSLQEAETEEYIIYPATFYPFEGIETNGNEYFKFILYLYYRHNERNYFLFKYSKGDMFDRI